MIDPDLMALMFVRALLQGTDPITNKAHEISPCPICIWEDEYTLLDSVKGQDERSKE